MHTTSSICCSTCSVTDIPIPNDSGYAVLASFLHHQNRTIHRVLGDGNCLFRSQLTGTQNHHLELRKAIVLFEERNEAIFKPLHETILTVLRVLRILWSLITVLSQNTYRTWYNSGDLALLIIVSGWCIHCLRHLLSWEYYMGEVHSTCIGIIGRWTSRIYIPTSTCRRNGLISHSHFDAIKPTNGEKLTRPTLTATSTHIDLTSIVWHRNYNNC